MAKTAAHEYDREVDTGFFTQVRDPHEEVKPLLLLGYIARSALRGYNEDPMSRVTDSRNQPPPR